MIEELLKKEFVASVSKVAIQAGNLIMQIYREGFDIEYKQDHSPVTSADITAHKYILNELNLLTPELPVLSEESTYVSFPERSNWDTYWLIDPLDGTREFIKKNGEFSVNIALIHHQRTYLGIVHIPANDTTYSACKNLGSNKKVGDGNNTTIQTRQSSPKHSPTICGSRAHAGKSLQLMFEHLGEYNMISVGSSIKTCYVAEGLADLYPRFGPTSEWDTAAAQCILEEAGGSLIDLNFNPLMYNTKDSLINPSFLVLGDYNPEWKNFLSTYLKARKAII